MEQGTTLNLLDVGDAVYRVMQRFLFRNGNDPGAEIWINSSSMQESINVKLADSTTLLIKIFPHKNYLLLGVFRIEVYKTKPKDMRGNRIAFVEVPNGTDGIQEIKLFIEGVLSQNGL